MGSTLECASHNFFNRITTYIMKMAKVIICVMGALLLLTGCSQDDDHGLNQVIVDPHVDWENHQLFTLDFNLSSLQIHQGFSPQAEARGESTLIEASGLAPSVKNPGYLWSHQDKNNSNQIFLLDEETGKTVASYTFDGVLNRDWEDIEIGPGPEEGEVYIYLGEIGDNNAVYGQYRIYRIPEPIFLESHKGQVNRIDVEVDIIEYIYPDKNHDAETLLLDPYTKDIFVVSKRDYLSYIYVLPYPQSKETTTTATKVGKLFFREATGGNISLDGRHMVIKNYERIFYWPRVDSLNMVDWLKTEPFLLPYNPVEPQGEAICFDINSKGYYTLSEFSNEIIPQLYYYKKQ